MIRILFGGTTSTRKYSWTKFHVYKRSGTNACGFRMGIQASFLFHQSSSVCLVMYRYWIEKLNWDFNWLVSCDFKSNLSVTESPKTAWQSVVFQTNSYTGIASIYRKRVRVRMKSGNAQRNWWKMATLTLRPSGTVRITWAGDGNIWWPSLRKGEKSWPPRTASSNLLNR